MTLQLKDSWFEKQKKLMQKRPQRRYLHFDKPITLTPLIVNKVVDPKFIESYAFFPLLKIAKSSRVYQRDKITKIKFIDWKERPISYASHFDSQIYSWYAYQLEHYYEKRLKEAQIDSNIIAYRKLSKSNVDFALEVFDFIKNNPSSATLALDVKGFYDNLDFSLIKKSWKNNLGVTDLPKDHYNVYKSITKYSYIRLREVFKLLKPKGGGFRKSPLFLGIDLLQQLRINNKVKTNKSVGIPQGTPISCVISNVYMFDFDIDVAKKVKEIGGLYRRYSDDIIIVCPKTNILEMENFIQEKIKGLKLEIQKAKTEIRYFSYVSDELVCNNELGKLSKLQYLGVEYTGKDVILRHKGYARYERRMKAAIVRKIAKSKKKKIPLFKRNIYDRFSPLGKQNYFSYTQSANKKMLEASYVVSLDNTNPHRIIKKINKKIITEKK